MRRRRTSTAFVVLTAVLAFITGPIWYTGELIRNEDRFVAVSDKILAHPDIRQATAERATVLTLDALETDEAVAELLPGASRSLAVPISQLATEAMTDAAFELLDTEVALRARDSALREVHGQLTADEQDVVIDLRPVLTRVAREVAGPTAGSAVTQFLADSEDGRIILAEADSTTARAASGFLGLRSSSWFFAIGTLASLVAAVVVATDRRRALIRAGLALSLGATGAVLLVAIVLQATPLLTDTALGPEIGTGLAEAVSADFGEQQRSGVVGGLVLAFVGLLLGPRRSAVALRSLPGAIWRQQGTGVLRILSTVVVDNPALARMVAWLGPALLLVSWPNPTTRVVTIVLLGTAIGQFGIWFLSSTRPWAADRRGLLGLADQSPATTGIGASLRRWRLNLAGLLFVLFLFWPGWNIRVIVGFFVMLAIVQAALDLVPARRLAKANAVPDPEPVQSADTGWSWPRLAAGAVAVLVLGGIVANTAFSAEEAAAQVGCNGHIELCDRAIDELVWAGSHNSMSSSDIGWELAAQTGDMVAQLDHGVRALLIDTHYWDGRGTFEGEDDPTAAAAIEAALDNDRPRPGLWLCHGPCALGSTDLIAALADIDIWLDENPREVVMFVVQDEISTEDTFEAFEASGLIDRAYRHEPGSPFPTLGELIEREERIVVYAENEGSSDSWYQNAWETAFVDTPFKFDVRSDFSCEYNRGAADNPLLLVNHWLTTGIPSREAAEVVNSKNALEERVVECQDVQGRTPNVIAVDFAQTGDLIEVVDELNGVPDNG